MINQLEWLRARKNLLEQVKSQVQIRLGPLPEALRRYAKNLDRDFRRAWRPCAAQDLNRALRQAQVVLSGDFHAYAQSQRAHMRLLRDHCGERPILLVLECLAPDHEAAAQDFLHGRISESRFLQIIDWQKNWGFPWENYRPLFELARDRGWLLRGINDSRSISLLRRDQWTAKRLAEFHRQHPEHLQFVIIGEWHLALANLPKALKAHFKEPQNLAIVHQDVERLYFQLAAKDRESSVEILRAPHGRYCLMVSPPWMKWQSYLMFLEQAYDRDLQEELAIDYTEHVVSLIQVLESDLGIEFGKSQIQVYTPTSKTSLLRSRLVPAAQEKALVYQLEHDLSFFVPRKGWLYLSRPTINHASSLAGQWLHAQLCHRTRALWTMPRDYLPLIWVEAMGFFFSKWINPKRKAETLESIRLRLAAQHPKERGRKALLLALDHRLSEVLWVRTGRLRKPKYKPRETVAYLDAARINGSMLGERLFQKVRSRTISLTKLMTYLRVNVERQDFAEFYWQLIAEIEHDQSL
jgi:uncharacterized iron-regulated protein